MMPGTNYLFLLHLHGLLRWFILLSGTVLLAGCLIGTLGKIAFRPLGRFLFLLYVSLLDIQFLVGVLLSLTSPLVRIFWNDMASGMKQHDPRFFAMEHPTLMIVALILAHIGAIRSKRAEDQRKACSTALLWGGLSFLLILAGIPWWRPVMG
jgi:hypothetical protein